MKLLLLLHHELRLLRLLLLLLHMVLRNVLGRRLSKLLTIRRMRLRWRLRTSWCPRRRGIARSISSRAGNLTPTTGRSHLLHARLMLRAYTPTWPVLTLMSRASHSSRINGRRVSAGYHRTHRPTGPKVGMLDSLALRSHYLHSRSHVLSTRSSGSNESASASHGVTSSHNWGSHTGYHARLGRAMPLKALLLRRH